jgi:hypothetical protein
MERLYILFWRCLIERTYILDKFTIICINEIASFQTFGDKVHSHSYSSNTVLHLLDSQNHVNQHPKY